MSIFAALSLGANLISGMQAKSSANAAARRYEEAANFNASLIERNSDLLEKQRELINANFLVDVERAKIAFDKEVQGTAKAGFGYAGFDMSVGTPMAVLVSNAQEFEYEQAVRKYNNSVTNMQISDAQEENRLNAELARMEGGAQAAGMRAQGTASMIRQFGQAANYAYETGIFA